MYVYMYAYMRECVCVFVYTYRICIDLYTPRYTYTGKRSQDLRTHVRVPARAHTHRSKISVPYLPWIPRTSMRFCLTYRYVP